MDEQQQQNTDLSDLEIAELANKELKTKDKEIAELKRQLAQAKLYQKGEEEERVRPSKEDCMKILTNPRTCQYDYAQATIDLCDIEEEQGRPNPLGKNGEAVKEFFQDCIDECDGDKSRFVSVYQARIGKDTPTDSLAYKGRK